jgi:hypothetical protein
VALNPSISSGLPLPTVNRNPPPGSRPEKYSTPATKGGLCFSCVLVIDSWYASASDPAQNPYWKRDMRRAYPQLSVVTQPNLSTLLIQHSGTPSYAPLICHATRIAHLCHVESLHLPRVTRHLSLWLRKRRLSSRKLSKHLLRRVQSHSLHPNSRQDLQRLSSAGSPRLCRMRLMSPTRTSP